MILLLRDKIRNGRLYVERAIAGCGGFEKYTCADILSGKYIGNDEFSLSIYPASQPIFMELVKNGTIAKLMETGATIRTAFCGPCFGAGDVPANKGLSIRHTTRNFPNREGSKITNGQIASVALMDARSIAATAKSGYLTSAEDMDVNFANPSIILIVRFMIIVFMMVLNSRSHCGSEIYPGIGDWPEMSALSEDLILKVVSVIHDPVYTTDELILPGDIFIDPTLPCRIYFTRKGSAYGR